MTVLTYLDSYCERAGQAGMLAEPLNLFTNGFFILAALLSARAIARANITGKTGDLWLLAFFMFAIGIGSGLWHAFPSASTVLMDVIPITLFINAYILSALRRLFGLPWPSGRKFLYLIGLTLLPILLADSMSGEPLNAVFAVCFLLQLYVLRGTVIFYWWLYFTAGIAAQKLLPPDLLHGTIMYIPTYLALAVMTVLLRCREPNIGRVFTLALSVWTLSLLLRTVDLSVCPSLAIGTHFLWHTLNAFVLWRLLKVLIARAELK